MIITIICYNFYFSNLDKRVMHANLAATQYTVGIKSFFCISNTFAMLKLINSLHINFGFKSLSFLLKYYFFHMLLSSVERLPITIVHHVFKKLGFEIDQSDERRDSYFS